MIELDDPVFLVTVSLAIIALLSLITTFYFFRKSNKKTSDFFEKDILFRQIEFIDRYNERIYSSPHGKEIIECIKNETRPILQNNGGKVSERELENFLNDLLSLNNVQSLKLVDSDLIYSSFSWVLGLVKNSLEIKEYVKKVQELQGKKYYQTLIE